MNIASRALGYSGPRTGMSPAQRSVVAELLTHAWREAEGWVPDTVVHGGCEGGDWEFHQLVLEYLPADTKIIVYPSDMTGTYPEQIRELCRHGSTLAAAWGACGATFTYPAEPPLLRNSMMVAYLRWAANQGAGRFIATPADTVEQLRSGTWATIRRVCRAANVQRHIIGPTGEDLGL